MRTIVTISDQVIEVELDTEQDLPFEGKGKCLLLPHGKQIALFCSDGNYWAISNTCTHEGGPLCDGDLEGTTITCPWHGWQFDIRTGKCQNLIGEDVEHYDIEKRGNSYWLIVTKKSSK